MDVLYLQDTKTEMEKQKREHQESSANLAAKHSQELKDLGKTRISVMIAQKHGVQVFVRICLYINTYRVVLQPEADGGA